MMDLRFFVVPAALLAGIVGYVALNPVGAAVEPLPTDTPTATAEATNTPWPTYTPSPTATPFPGELQLSGLSGTLTYQSTGLVSVEFPSGAVVDSPVIGGDDWSASDDGEWRQDFVCADNGGCRIGFRSNDGRRTEVDGEYFVHNAAWQPGGHAIAIGLADSHEAPMRRIAVIDNPAAPAMRDVIETATSDIYTFDWINQGFIVSQSLGAGSHVLLVMDSGTVREVGEYASAVNYLHRSSDGHTFAFTISDPAGWRLLTVDANSGLAADRGAMGSDGPGGVPVPDAPDGGKGPMFIAWSPDGSRLAFGGGFEPPYSMTVVDVTSGAIVRTPFASGYPGEIRWSPDGTQIAVSTYDAERTHHETWVVDPATGAGTHLMDGCIIVWSPDSRFLAVHGEDVPGIAIVEAAAGARMQLTAHSTDAPLMWTE